MHFVRKVATVELLFVWVRRQGQAKIILLLVLRALLLLLEFEQNTLAHRLWRTLD